MPRNLLPSSQLEVGAQRRGHAGMEMETIIGGVAAFCTTASYLPQVHKCWTTGRAGDLSLRMFLILAAGIGLWAVYGVMRSDPVIIVANAVSLALLLVILFFKLRETRGAAAP